jgi:hypothetical protein
MRIRSHNTGFNPRYWALRPEHAVFERTFVRIVVAKATNWADNEHNFINVADLDPGFGAFLTSGLALRFQDPGRK